MNISSCDNLCDLLVMLYCFSGTCDSYYSENIYVQYLCLGMSFIGLDVELLNHSSDL